MKVNCERHQAGGGSLSTRQADLVEQLDVLRLEVADLRGSLKRLTLVYDAERRRIEQALHDGVQQQLVGLAADLELATDSIDADPASARIRLAELGRDIRQALEDARALADRIYPPLLERGGLVPALRTAAARAAVPIRIDVATGTVYPPGVARLVYSCCLDLLEHAGAGTPMTITVRNQEDTLTFEIGIDRDLDTEELPLRDRCEALGGRFDVRSVDHQTRLIGTVPLSG